MDILKLLDMCSICLGVNHSMKHDSMAVASICVTKGPYIHVEVMIYSAFQTKTRIKFDLILGFNAPL